MVGAFLPVRFRSGVVVDCGVGRVDGDVSDRGLLDRGQGVATVSEEGQVAVDTESP